MAGNSRREAPQRSASTQTADGRGSERSPMGARAVPARISLLYESRDGKLCVFQDSQGHLTAVRASRLA